jgi:putative peptide zinc metalloprotease protein
MLVGAAGIGVELFLGSIALFVWLSAEPGAVRAIAYNVMLISGISTLLFNGNPLLRFDGYYVLADAVEIPNLGTRANRYLGYLFQRHALGVHDAESPAESPGERAWMLFYGVGAFVYRVFILFVIIVFIAGKFFVVGVLLALWALATQALVPVGKSVAFLASNPGLRRQRGRAVGTTVAVVLGVLGLVFILPVPSWTRAQGVVWVPEEAQVRAGTEGFVERVLVAADSQVVRGQPLIEAHDPFLSTRVAVLKAQLRELTAQYDALVQVDRVQAQLVRAEIESVAANLERSREREAQLVLRSPANGRFVVPQAADLPGRFVTKGQLIAYVVEPKELSARVAIGQDDVAQVRSHTRGVEVMLGAWGSDPLPARIQREVPGGSRQLPSPALGSMGGGAFAVDPRDSQGVTAIARVFQLELALPPELSASYLGSRVFVRFDHGYEPLGFQVYRALRRLFLRQFDV